MWNPTKFGSPKLDLYNFTYDFPKLHANLEINELSFHFTVTDSRGPRLRRARTSTTVKTEHGAGRCNLASGETLRRHHRHDRDPQVLPNLLSYLARPIVGANDDGGVNGGTAVRIDGEMPALVVIAQSTATLSSYILLQN